MANFKNSYKGYFEECPIGIINLDLVYEIAQIYKGYTLEKQISGKNFDLGIEWSGRKMKIEPTIDPSEGIE